ncbi:hypothetical protein [Sphingobacterium tabacisoli]|uniref:Uncharacterized protein n=1 Tax=Sphingobacterium tabacisoli TaxID=2044855 RepID=A0ABW5L042_9SPHI|nr:hypothetical protein [Sphingobacterium tabacisoli]
MQYITIIIISFVLIGCRINRKKQETVKGQTKEQESLYLSLEKSSWQREDSSLSYWRLRTDSIFFYHPEGGVWSKGGEILVADARTHQAKGSMSTDSVQQKTEIDATGEWNYNWSRNIKDGGIHVFFWIVIVLVLLVIYRRV